MFKLAIVGGRFFIDYNLLLHKCDKLLVNKHPNIEIVYGVADGADTLGAYYAIEKKYPIYPCPVLPDQWNLTKSAGYKRNKYMAEYCDAAIAFWDGESKGTKHMIDILSNMGKKCVVVRYIPNQQKKSDYITYKVKWDKSSNDYKEYVPKLPEYYSEKYRRTYW